MQIVDNIHNSANTNASTGEMEATTRPEETIEQVRDLLFGSAQRSLEDKLTLLKEEMRSSVKELKEEFEKELATIRAMVEELERNSEMRQLDSHKEIGAAISQLGATISEMGSRRTGR
ncbi:hypothetical protein [Nitratireductor sp. GCM10026969]|uniref:hypothetical protein n=1 Tax=Nitratireductor sp. GCM10026969 TaxID=3252645 RepID=UPI0036222BCA